MSVTTILIVLLVLVCVGAMPTWGYSRSWGYGPFGGLLGIVAVIVIILLLTGHL